jgi:hypothetical protein
VQGRIAKVDLLLETGAPALHANAIAGVTTAGRMQFNTSPSIRSMKPRAWTGPEKAIGVDEMPLVTVVITLLVVGVLLWLVNSFIPMQGQIKGILNAVVVIAVVLWLLNVFGLFGYLTQFHVGH